MKKPIILTSIVLLIVFLLTFFILMPKYEEFNKKTAELEQREQDLKKLESYFSNLAKTKEKLQAFETELSLIDSALPSSSDMPSVFNFVQATAEKNGLVLSSVSLSSSATKTRTSAAATVTETGRMKNNSFSVSVSGSYSAFKNFLSEIEKSARFIEIESISFSSGFYGSGGIFDFNLQMKVYSY